jgi:hypothetical protein
MIKNLSLNIVVEDEAKDVNLDEILTNIKQGNLNEVSVNSSVDLDLLKRNLIESLDEDNVTIKDGVAGGCYGARDGTSYKGLTLYLNPGMLPDYIYEEDEEDGDRDLRVINYFAVMAGASMGYELASEEEEDDFEVKGGSFNWGRASMYEMAYQIKGNMVFARFHCGGDIRGNYTKVVKFEYHDICDFWDAIC